MKTHMMGRNRRKTRHEQTRIRSEVYRARHRILSRMRKEAPKGIEKDIQEIREAETASIKFTRGYAGAWKTERIK